MQYMTSLLIFAALIYAILVGYLYLFQRQLMYLPDRQIAAPAHYGLDGFEDLRVKSADNGLIQLWHRPAIQGMPTVAYFHGNAGHIGHRAGILSRLAEKGFGVLAVSYRGYGASDGLPGEAGIYNDARAAIHFLTAEKRLPLENIILYGESLGSGVATQMATEYKVGALVLEAPYTSVSGRAAEIYYYVPVRLLIRDHFDSLSKITRITSPLLIFHGERDTVIPIAHGKLLYETATVPKRSFFFPQYAHNDFDSGMIASHVLDFAREHHLITP